MFTEESSTLCVANLSTVMRNLDSKLPFLQLTFLNKTANCSSTSSAGQFNIGDRAIVKPFEVCRVS